MKYIGLALFTMVAITIVIWGVRWAVAPIEGNIGAREQIQPNKK